MKYKILLTGKIRTGVDPQVLANTLRTRLGWNRKNVHRILSGTPGVFRDGLEAAKADKILSVLDRLGVEARKEARSGLDRHVAEPPRRPSEMGSIGAGQTGQSIGKLSGNGSPTPSPDLDEADLLWQSGHCPKCGRTLRMGTAAPAPDSPCPDCDAIPAKYLHYLLKKQEQTKREAFQDKIHHSLENRSTSMWSLSEWIPVEMFRWARWGFAVIGLILLLTGGYSVFKLPTREILYDPVLNYARCTSDSKDPEVLIPELGNLGLVAEAEQCAITGVCSRLCRRDYALHIGNTGLLHQPQVVVRLHEHSIEDSTAPLVFLNYDRVQRKVRAHSREGIRSYALGGMGPTEQVVLRMTLTAADEESLPQWGDILREIAVPKGDVHEGPPKLSLLTRMMLRTFKLFTPTEAIKTGANVFLDSDPQSADGEILSIDSLEGIDLRLTEQQNTARGPGGAVTDHTLIIRNQGIENATGVVVKLKLDSAFTLRRSSLMFEIENDFRHSITQMGLESRGSHRPCSQHGQQVMCRIAKVRPDDIAILSLMFRYMGRSDEQQDDGEDEVYRKRFKHQVTIKAEQVEANTEDNQIVIESRLGER